ncbi:MAG: glycosyltransferase family 9 protein [Ignavibacteria bacterium]|nr:glycosyltransferase family 9 protein [Ignavibacteria bacterium]
MGKRILIIQTAFLGDVILTLPLVQVLKKHLPDSPIDFLCIPSVKDLFKHNPLINKLIVYDKRGEDTFGRIKNEIKGNYDIVISPHRSARSALLAFSTKAKQRITFNKSSLSFLYTDKIKYETGIHEIQRNLSLLRPLGIDEKEIIRPELFIGDEERKRAQEVLNEYNVSENAIALTPGSVWFTKRYPKEKFGRLLELLKQTNEKVFLIGGESDKELGDFLISYSQNENVINTAGKLNVLESAELIRRCRLLITNDSAPLHLANSVGTKVVSLWGATIPQFGFFPYGENDIIIETEGLKCRPCSIHGGDKCPIGTFDCMRNIPEEKICEIVVQKA